MTLRKLLPSPNAIFMFEAAARHLNFTSAAREFNVTQSAISRMIARLESHLDVKLFLRTPTGIELTDDGRMLYGAVGEGFAGELLSYEAPTYFGMLCAAYKPR